MKDTPSKETELGPLKNDLGPQKNAVSPQKAIHGPLKPLPQVNMVQEVVERLRGQILAGAFDPDGQIPPEGKLGQTLGVSRTVIREAMRILATQGLVVVSRGRCPQVKPADPQTVVDTFSTYLQREDHSLGHLLEVRRPLEAAIVALAAERASDSDLQLLEQSIESQAAARSQESRIEEDIRFHDLLALATGNPVFTLMLKAVVGLMRRARKETLAHSGIQRSLDGHRGILEAVRRRDSDAARQAMLTHLCNADEDIRRNRG